MQDQQLYHNAIRLLQQLIAISSFSKFEEGTADELVRFLEENRIPTHRLCNNVWAVNKNFDPAKPTLLLNSHHDTVKPNPQYTIDPFLPLVKGDKLYGLGSNDAGGCLVSLIAAFIHFYDRPDLRYNLVIAASAEEEISGKEGIELLLANKHFKKAIGQHALNCGIVGEPTKMDLAIAEKGLMVLDCVSYGTAGHAARNEGDNALYHAVDNIQWFKTYQFEKVSEWLGPIKMSVTSISTENKTHNIIPDSCRFVVDVRITEMYTHEEVLATIQNSVDCEVTPRSMRLRSSGISLTHPLVEAGLALGKQAYGSPTSSDKAFMNFPTLKCGPGDSSRSHTADEFIYLHEVEAGIKGYIDLLSKVIL